MKKVFGTMLALAMVVQLGMPVMASETDRIKKPQSCDDLDPTGDPPAYTKETSTEDVVTTSTQPEVELMLLQHQLNRKLS